MVQQVEQTNRFKDAPWFPQNQESVLIGGAGGIGSWLTFFLARAGFSPILYDFDTVETHNLGGQLFAADHVGMTKVASVADTIQKYVGASISTIPEKVDETTEIKQPFVFAAFDDMSARKALFQKWMEYVPNAMVKPIFIDGRLEMEQLQIFCITEETAAWYAQEHLFANHEVEDTPCTMKQTSHTAALIASMMVSFFTNHLTNVYQRKRFRYLPKYFEMYTPTLSITIEDAF